MTAPADPRAILRRHGVHARRSYSQNFLVDPSAIARIVAAAEVGAGDVVVEIGAGPGTLTRPLAATGAHVHAIEPERAMLDILRAELGTLANVEVQPIDALTLDLGALARAAGRPLVVVGNLPYAITSPLVMHVLAAGPAVARAVLMVQREVAQRMVAPPGDKIYGRLSVGVQRRAAARRLFDVRPGAFLPAPRVVSSVVRLDPRPAPAPPVQDEATFDRLVRAAFGTRRKMLRRALADAFGEAALAAAFAAAGIDGTRRAETCSLAELAALSDALTPAAGRDA